MITKIDDYQIFTNYLLQQYRESVNLNSIVNADMKQANDIETALFEIRDNFWLSTAEGTQLDVIGSIQGQSRLGMNDTDYRAMIGTKIAVNQGSGEPETIINTIKNLYGAGVVLLQFPGGATLQVFTDVIFTEEQKQLLIQVIPAGVELLTVIFNLLTPFGFLNDPDSLGFGKLIYADLELSDGDVLILSDGDSLYLNTNQIDSLDVNAGVLSAALL